MKNIDTLLHARWIIPVDNKQRYLEQHCIAIHEKKIIDILPSTQAKARYSARVSRDYNQHALIPGLINSHTHAAMSLFRGLADDLNLMDWLQNHIWPAEAEHVNEAFVHTGTELAIAEIWDRVWMGDGGGMVSMPLLIDDINPERLTLGREAWVLEVLQELIDGYIETGVDPITGIAR